MVSYEYGGGETNLGYISGQNLEVIEQWKRIMFTK